MNDLYAFVTAANRLKEMDKDRMKLLMDMLLQTTECTYFIQHETHDEKDRKSTRQEEAVIPMSTNKVCFIC